MMTSLAEHQVGAIHESPDVTLTPALSQREREQDPEGEGAKPRTMVQALNLALAHAMADDERVVAFGEDVGLNGGVFRVTEGLQARFGVERVFDTPLCESAIVGAAFGMAVAGLLPVAEIQFADYTYPAFDQITNEVAKLRYRSGGQYSCPMVLRTPYGGGIRGGHYHSQSPEAYYTQTPGLVVVTPSTPQDAYGLLRSAIASPDPVIFLEPKRLYRQGKALLPLRNAQQGWVPLGEVRHVVQGDDLTVLTYGAMVPLAEEACQTLTTELGVSIELIDLRTLYPVPEEAILESVRKTGRVLIAYEAPKTCGYGAELAALIAERAVDVLQAPIVRVGGFDTPYPYALEAAYYPTANRLAQAMRQVLAYR